VDYSSYKRLKQIFNHIVSHLPHETLNSSKP